MGNSLVRQLIFLSLRNEVEWIMRAAGVCVYAVRCYAWLSPEKRLGRTVAPDLPKFSFYERLAK